MVAAKHQSLRLLSLSTSHWTISESFFRPFLSGYFSRTKQVDTVPSARHMKPMIRYVHGAPNFCNSAFITNGITRPPIPLPLAERPNASPRRLSNHWGTIPIIVYNIAIKINTCTCYTIRPSADLQCTWPIHPNRTWHLESSTNATPKQR